MPHFVNSLSRFNPLIWVATFLCCIAVSVAADEDAVVLRLLNAPEQVLSDQERVDEALEITLAQLQALPATSFETETIWTDGEQAIVGVQFVDFFDWLGLPVQDVRALAINDYAITLPAADMIDGGAVIAYVRNDELMSRREKGPLWVLYPFDDNADFRTEMTYSRAVWHLDRIDFVLE